MYLESEHPLFLQGRGLFSKKNQCVLVWKKNKNILLTKQIVLMDLIHMARWGGVGGWLFC